MGGPPFVLHLLPEIQDNVAPTGGQAIGYSRTTGKYLVSFYAASRVGLGPNSLFVNIDGTNLTFGGSPIFTPPGTNIGYQFYTSDPVHADGRIAHTSLQRALRHRGGRQFVRGRRVHHARARTRDSGHGGDRHPRQPGVFLAAGSAAGLGMLPVDILSSHDSASSLSRPCGRSRPEICPQTPPCSRCLRAVASRFNLAPWRTRHAARRRSATDTQHSVGSASERTESVKHTPPRTGGFSPNRGPEGRNVSRTQRLLLRSVNRTRLHVSGRRGPHRVQDPRSHGEFSSMATRRSQD